MKSLNILSRTYPSGFKAKVIERPHFAQKFMGIIVNFGGSDPQLLSGGAHFLEHKLFAKKDGDISKKIENLNANSNAFTSYNETMFYVEFVEHWRKLLPLLFELVGTTYFTKQNITKEAKIISQELAMYQDDPAWKVSHDLLMRMYPHTNLAQDLTGTQSSIRQMTPDILQKIYTDNYFAKNMQFVACGGFSHNQAKSILTEIGKLEQKFITPQGASKIEFKDVASLNIKDQVLFGEVAVDRIGIGIKMPDFKDLGLANLTNSQIQLVLEMMLQARLGQSSPWFEDMQKEGIVSAPLSISVNYTRQGNFIIISAISSQPTKLISRIIQQINYGQITQKMFELQKKDYLARHIREFDEVDTLAIEEAEMGLDKDSCEALLQTIQTLSFSEFCEIFATIRTQSDIFTTILTQKKSDKQ